MSKFWKDFVERLLWTIAEVGAGFAIVETADLDTWWVVPLTSVLMAVKGFAARKVGDPDTAGTASL